MSNWIEKSGIFLHKIIWIYLFQRDKWLIDNDDDDE